MNKGELVSAVAEATGLNNKQSKEAVDAFIAAVSGAVKGGESVQIAGFGTFLAKTRPARKGRNPSTGEVMDIPEKTSAVFKPASVLKNI